MHYVPIRMYLLSLILLSISMHTVLMNDVWSIHANSALIGTPFFIMDYVHGRILKQADLPGIPSEQRFAIYSAMNQLSRTIVTSHSRSVGYSYSVVSTTTIEH
jgi:hypothetical protein